MSLAEQLTWESDTAFLIGDARFELQVEHRFRSTAERFCVVKTRALVEQYVTVLDELRPRRIVELGINKGGSTAMLATLARPDRMLAVELAEARVVGLDQYLEGLGLAEAVTAAYGVDQGDQPRLGDLLHQTFGDEPLDLVIDDASHELDLSRLSFDVLFPAVRPGGLYIIEDWAWAHMLFEGQRPGHPSLALLAFEIVLALPFTPGLIEEIRVTREWVAVRRGPLVLQPGFAIQRAYGPRGRSLLHLPEA